MKKEVAGILILILLLQCSGCKKNCGDPIEPFTGVFQIQFIDKANNEDYFISQNMNPKEFVIINSKSKEKLSPEIQFQNNFNYLTIRRFPNFYSDSLLRTSPYETEICRDYILKFSEKIQDTVSICLIGNNRIDGECERFYFSSIKIFNSKQTLIVKNINQPADHEIIQIRK